MPRAGEYPWIYGYHGTGEDLNMPKAKGPANIIGFTGPAPPLGKVESPFIRPGHADDDTDNCGLPQSPPAPQRWGPLRGLSS